jgi:hypothetical protein
MKMIFTRTTKSTLILKDMNLKMKENIKYSASIINRWQWGKMMLVSCKKWFQVDLQRTAVKN